MSVEDVQKLTPRQKEILRLLLNGFDAKSAGRELGISVHTVNEHLREARRHLGVSSSREAARIVKEAEGDTPNGVGPNSFGMVRPAGRRSGLAKATPDGLVVYAGVALMILVAAAVVALFIGKGGAASETGEAPPKVVATTPSQGATIAPGPFTLAVTFDRAMLDGNYSFVQVSSETYPSCEPRPQLSRNSRTFTLRCTAQASHTYEVWFNRPPYMNFKSVSGAAAQPHQLRFRAKST